MSILRCTRGALAAGITVAPLSQQTLELVMIVSHIIERIRAYMRYRASVRALSQLSERELADIGLTRGDIDTVAKQTAQA